MNKQDYYGAISDFTMAIVNDPKFALAYYGRGIAKDYLQDYRGAIEDLTVGIQIDPKDKNIYYYRACIKGKLYDFNGAISDLDIAIMIDPNYVEAYATRGMLRIVLGYKDIGHMDLTKAIELGLFSNEKYNAISAKCTEFVVRYGH